MMQDKFKTVSYLIKNKEIKSYNILAGMACVLLVSISGPAHAGFEWTPPNSQTAPPVTETTDSMVPPITAMPVEPVMAEPTTVPDNQALAVVEKNIVPTPPVAPPPAPIVAAASPVPVDDNKVYEEISGFGRDLPLVLAMRQIVPLEYGYAFDDGINPALRVSWDGGAPWDQVLKQALAPFNLDAVITNDKVWIVTSEKVTNHQAKMNAGPAQNLVMDIPVNDNASSTVIPVATMSGEAITWHDNTASEDNMTASSDSSAPGRPDAVIADNIGDDGTLADYEMDTNKDTANDTMTPEPDTSYDQKSREEMRYLQVGLQDSNYNPSYPRRAPELSKAPIPLVAESEDDIAVSNAPSVMQTPEEQSPATRINNAKGGSPVLIGKPQMDEPKRDYELPVSDVSADTSTEDVVPMASVASSMPSGLMKADVNTPRPPVQKEAPAVSGLSYTSEPAPKAMTISEQKTKAMDPFEIRYWEADQDQSLHAVLDQWTADAGVNLYWYAPADYKLPAPVHLHGTFPDAVTRVLTTYNEVTPRPTGRLHPNLPDGPSVLIIEGAS